MKNQKKLIILTGPSGVGKGTVVREILGKETENFCFIFTWHRESLEFLLLVKQTLMDTDMFKTSQNLLFKCDLCVTYIVLL